MPQKPRTPVTPVSPMDTLEPRTLLSAGVEPATMWTDWGGLALPHRAGQFVVTFDGALGDQGARAKASDLAAALGVGLVDFRSIGGGRYGRLTVDGTFSRPLAERAAGAVGGVRTVEPDVIYNTTRVPNDPFYTQQWGLSNTGQTINGRVGVAGADIDAPLNDGDVVSVGDWTFEALEVGHHHQQGVLHVGHQCDRHRDGRWRGHRLGGVHDRQVVRRGGGITIFDSLETLYRLKTGRIQSHFHP